MQRVTQATERGIVTQAPQERKQAVPVTQMACCAAAGCPCWRPVHAPPACICSSLKNTYLVTAQLRKGIACTAIIQMSYCAAVGCPFWRHLHLLSRLSEDSSADCTTDSKRLSAYLVEIPV